MNVTQHYEYKVWDLPTRLFHWINFTTVIVLIFVGLVMLFKKELGIESVEAKIALKELHVIVGYVFVANLAVRIAWGFIGNRYARWRSLIPAGNYAEQVSAYLKA